METIYVLNLENYEGENAFEFFHHKENAERRYNELLKENRHKAEFESDNRRDNIRAFSFFDPDYNEYSTFITLTENTLNGIFED